jgi:hypothetical protein
MLPSTYKKYYNILTSHLIETYNVGIIEKAYAEDAWYPNLNLIYINKNLKYQQRLYSLLHEGGHAIIDNSIRQKNVLCFNKNTPHNVRSKKNYVHTLNEEILAWNYGKQLVKSLGFKIDEAKLDEYMTDCIMSYVKSGLESVYGKEINVRAIRSKYV